MKRKKNQLPNTIYIKHERDGDSTYYLAGCRPEDLAEGMGSTVVVGEYVLKSKLAVKTAAEIKRVP